VSIATILAIKVNMFIKALDVEVRVVSIDRMTQAVVIEVLSGEVDERGAMSLLADAAGGLANGTWHAVMACDPATASARLPALPGPRTPGT
jgi:hypothetical protein